MELGLILLVSRGVSRGVFIDGCELIMALGTLSANEWVCVLTLLPNAAISASTMAAAAKGGRRS